MTINDSLEFDYRRRPVNGIIESASHDKTFHQDLIAVVGFANRLPGHSTNPTKLWELLEKGGIAPNEPPESRFGLKGHYDGSRKPGTMRTPGGMFIEDIDVAEFDAPFFNIPRVDAIAMDPQQRQLLEVVYEGLENSGITLEELNGANYGCWVGSYAVDYMDIAARDPEDRPLGITVGGGRAILSNRISHFLNIKGPSMTVDTACSGTLVSLDVACHYLHTRQIEGAIIAGANIYCSPEHCLDMGAMRGASSATGKCHTFDAKADGYCRSEAINTVILKRLDDAIRHGDPIRAVIRGTSTNSDGWTPGIASPNSDAQAVAIRAAYAAAGITDFNGTQYLECHGTGTLAGDPIEVSAAASVFGQTRSSDDPLIIGSIKSNIGHSEPAAGVSGLLKAVLSVEKGIIPGNPTFIDPNPKIDFARLKVRASRTALKWPSVTARRASVNSFGYGGSNAHAVIQDTDSFVEGYQKTYKSSFAGNSEDLFADDDDVPANQPHILVFSANDEQSIKSYCQNLKKHLSNPSVSINLGDLAHTLSEKRSRHFHRAYVVTQRTDFDQTGIVYGKKTTEPPKIGFVFTGQGAQWSQMGKGVIDTFPSSRILIERLDRALQSLPTPPKWSILDELVQPRSPEHLRLPEFSQPLVTALQLVMLNVFNSWGVHAQSVVGHSSGEIAAACAAGLLSPEDAIKIAFFRGQAAKELEAESETAVGMMAVGLGAVEAQEFIGDSADAVEIACYNSPGSITLSGKVEELEKIKTRLLEKGHFARLLQVNLAYHSKFMKKIGDRYEQLLLENCNAPLPGQKSVSMFSSVIGARMDGLADAKYWKTNMVSPVRFDAACGEMISGRDGADFLIEIGPSGALAGPVSQIKKELSDQGSKIQYVPAAKRGPTSVMSMFDVAGRLFISAGSINLRQVNFVDGVQPLTIIDLPNYSWNHSTKYWHESDSSRDWRYRPFLHHDLLGSKVHGAPWNSPVFKKKLDIKDVPWLKDHKMGSDIIFPAAGYIGMAMEAIYQTSCISAPEEVAPSVDELAYRLRNVKFEKALVLEEGNPSAIMLTLNPYGGLKETWYTFKVTSMKDGQSMEHCQGLIRLEEKTFRSPPAGDLSPLKHTKPGNLWYKAMSDVGYGFGPLFQKLTEVESLSGHRQSRSFISMLEPPSAWSPQSAYPMHPVCIDGCFQSTTPSLVSGRRTEVNSVLLPSILDELIIFPNGSTSESAISIAEAEYVGRGQLEESKNYMASCNAYDSVNGRPLLQLSGLRFIKLDTGMDPYRKQIYTSTRFQEDVSFLTQDLVSKVFGESDSASLGRIIDLVAHKKPTMKVLEVNLDQADTTSLWFEGDDSGSRAAYRQFSYFTSDANTLLNVEGQYEGHRDSTFSLIDMSKPDSAPADSKFDLIITKAPTFSEKLMNNLSKNIKSLLSPEGYVLLVERMSTPADSDSDDAVLVNGHGPLGVGRLEAILQGNGFSKTLKIPCTAVKALYLSTTGSDIDSSQSKAESISMVTLSPKGPPPALKASLESSGWAVSSHIYPLELPDPQSIVVIADELVSPVLATITEEQWGYVKELISRNCKILWITSGSQFEVTNPSNALVHGFFRTIRAENPMLRLATLDVESGALPLPISIINSILGMLNREADKSQVENEFVERRGIVYVNRVFLDLATNQFKDEQSRGGEPKVKSIHDLVPCARLRAERVGTFDSLQFGEISEDALPVKPNNVEVEISAASLNFKDVAVTMGIVPENEKLLGLEGAGIVTRVGDGVTTYKPGDRVLVFEKGTFANRIQATTERTHHLPDNLSFEDAATLPSVYLTSMYALFNLANLQKGQTVLIHSAAGGVGYASIQLARYKGAEIYVTVGTEEKRKFLTETFGIPEDHIFSSRTRAFGAQILEATQGRGIDVILNSLTGELLNESWKICADGGTMVEIGKKDILDRNSLPMEPFDRNCSFIALDFSHKQISDTLIHTLLDQIFELIKDGHITPVRPIKVFPFEDFQSAFALLRSGKHLGKLVLSDMGTGKVEVPVRPADRRFSLRSDVSYLIVGGLKGLCGSLAIYMAEHGARHIVVMSRSGSADETSQGVIQNCNALGCQVVDAKGDVANLEDVKRAFHLASPPIGGVVQGAMVLRDKPYEIMTVGEFHTTISNKVQGTLNLHNVSLEAGTPLDFFTMLSSISGVLGQKGQANYAAANVFLDAFALYRQQLGLKANSVDLGVIEDVGYIAARDGMQQQLDTDQWLGISEGVLRRILSLSILQQTDRSINQATSAQLVTGIPVPQPEDSALTKDARFGPLFIGKASTGGGRGGDDGSREIKAFFLRLNAGEDMNALLPAGVEILNRQFMKTLRSYHICMIIISTIDMIDSRCC